MKRRFRDALWCLLWWTAMALPAYSADSLPAPVAEAIKQHGISASGLSIYVQPVDASVPIVTYAADEPRNPASTMKLLTTLAALETLGPGYQWKTEVYATGSMRNDQLHGDLYIKGYGDPYLVTENFWRLVRSVRASGLMAIRGDLVLDQSYFAIEAGDPASFDGAPTRAYNVLPRALLVNFQAVKASLRPGGGRVRVHVDPPLPYANRLRLVTTPCHGGAHGWDLRVQQRLGQPRLVFSGRYAADCGDYDLFRVLLSPATHTHAMFQVLWRESGGRFSGRVRESPVPAQTRLLHTEYSPPLADIVRSINKYSNNVMTRQLLLTLGAEREGAPGTMAKGIAALYDWLGRRGLNFPELVLDNGTGLSRDERISARHLGELLLLAHAGPYMPEFVSALPVSSVDGTLRRRYAGELAGRMHLKTGSLEGVRTIAGYVLDRAGRRIAVVCLHNHPNADGAGGAAVQEALLRWIYDRP